MDNKSVLKCLSQFVVAVEQMEQAVLVPQSLQDMSLQGGNYTISNNGAVVDKTGLYDAFILLRNLKNIVVTGHCLDDKSEGNPIGNELQSLTQTLGKMSGLARSLTDEYKKNFDLLF